MLPPSLLSGYPDSSPVSILFNSLVERGTVRLIKCLAQEDNTRNLLYCTLKGVNGGSYFGTNMLILQLKR